MLLLETLIYHPSPGERYSRTTNSTERKSSCVFGFNHAQKHGFAQNFLNPLTVVVMSIEGGEAKQE